jgi:uncharacterized protein YidB (DUF937 family)
MGMLDDIVGSAVPKGNLAKPLMIALVALLASGALTRKGVTAESAPGRPQAQPDGGDGGDGGLLGGLGGLLNRFQQNGLGDVMDSWIGPGQNKPVAPGQLKSALGPDILKSLAQQTGLSQAELAEKLSQVLPGVVDKLTPAGRMPTEQEAARLI